MTGWRTVELLLWKLLLWPGEILFAYAICGFALFVVRKVPARWQLAIGIALLAVAAVKMELGYRGTLEDAGNAAQAQAVLAQGGTLNEGQRETLGNGIADPMSVPSCSNCRSVSNSSGCARPSGWPSTWCPSC